MPLPNDATLSLQKYTNPGDSSQTTPLQAMMVRMTAETFEALEKQDKPGMQIQFGENQGIIINGVLYPFNVVTENAPHEIYLRMPQPNKPNAPLRLFANVAAKLAVQRDFEGVKQQVRDRTQAAEKQRSERHTIVLQDPLPTTKHQAPKKRREPTGSRKPAAVDAHRNLSAPSSSTGTKVPSPRPVSPRPPPSHLIDPALRTQLINILGHLPRATTNDILSRLGIGMGDAERSARQEVQAHLRDVATYIKPADKPGEWTLFPECRSEVRPEEPPSRSAPPQAEAKRRVVSSDTRPKKPAASGRPSEAALARDERALSLRVDTLKGKERDTDDVSSPGTPNSSRPPTRRPGSGYKAPKTGSLTPTPDPSSSSNPPRRPALAEPRDVKREMPSPSLAPATRPPPVHERTLSNASTSTPAPRLPAKPRVSNGTSAPRHSATGKQERPESPAPLAAPSSGLKRKKVAQLDHDDYSDRDGPNLSFQKKRRVEEASGSKPREKGREERKERDLSLPKKPVTHDSSPRPPKRKEPSPPPRERPPTALPTHSPARPARSPLPDRDRDERAVSSSSSLQRRPRTENGGSQRSNGSAKPRRKSPTYTSSEDEPESSHTVARVPLAEEDSSSPAKPPPIKPLPKDPVTLQRMYKAKYPKYIQLYFTAKSAKDTLEEALVHAKCDTPDSDLEAEVVEVPPIDQLAELRYKLEDSCAELERIKAAYLTHTGMEIDIDRDIGQDIKEENDL